MSDVVYGSAYYPDYYPEEDWPGDLDRMVAAGIRSIRILEFGWCWYQPEPEVFRWEPMDRFLTLCQERTLAVCLSTPTAAPPPWFFQKHPDARLVNIDGRPCYAHRHMVCWNHPAANAEAMRTIEALATRYGRHPSVWGWQIDNEPSYAEDPGGYYDFNPHFLRDGRAWLRETYGSLEALNAAWFAAFWSQAANDWDQVWSTHLPTVNPQSALDFRRWRDASLARFVQQQAALLREHTDGQKIGVNIPETGLPFSVAIGQDYWAQAAGMDWVGTDLYTASGDREADMACFRQNCDIMRCVAESATEDGAEFVMSECQGGPNLRAWGARFASEAWGTDYLRQSVDVFVERGARQVWYFAWRPAPAGAEMGMFGVQTLDGTDTERTATIRELAQAPEQDRLTALRQTYAERPVALVHYSRDTLLFLDHFNALLEAGQSLRGVHRLLDEAGFRIDYVTDADLVRGDLPPAQRLVLAESALMSRTAQEHVLNWVRTDLERELHVGMNTALLNEYGHLLPMRERWLWNELGVEPGLIHDRKVSAQLDGRSLACFRALQPLDRSRACTEGHIHWQQRAYPARLRVDERTHVYAYRWGLERTYEGRHALSLAEAGT